MQREGAFKGGEGDFLHVIIKKDNCQATDSELATFFCPGLQTSVCIYTFDQSSSFLLVCYMKKYLRQITFLLICILPSAKCHCESVMRVCKSGVGVWFPAPYQLLCVWTIVSNKDLTSSSNFSKISKLHKYMCKTLVELTEVQPLLNLFEFLELPLVSTQTLKGLGGNAMLYLIFQL